MSDRRGRGGTTTSVVTQVGRHHFLSPRDPGGVNPKGIELKMGEDPLGFTATTFFDNLDRAEISTPSTTGNSSGSAIPGMTFYTGDPPPPPPNMPPPTKRKRSKSTPHKASKQVLDERQHQLQQSDDAQLHEPITSTKASMRRREPSPLFASTINQSSTPPAILKSASPKNQSPSDRVMTNAALSEKRLFGAGDRSSRRRGKSSSPRDMPLDEQVVPLLATHSLQVDPPEDDDKLEIRTHHIFSSQKTPTPRSKPVLEMPDKDEMLFAVRRGIATQTHPHTQQRSPSLKHQAMSPLSVATAPVSHVHRRPAADPTLRHNDIDSVAASPIRNLKAFGNTPQKGTPDRSKRVAEAVVHKAKDASPSPERQYGTNDQYDTNQREYKQRSQTPEEKHRMKTLNVRQRQQQYQRPKTSNARLSQEVSKFQSNDILPGAATSLSSSSKQKKSFFGRLFGSKKKNTVSDSSIDEFLLEEKPDEDCSLDIKHKYDQLVESFALSKKFVEELKFSEQRTIQQINMEEKSEASTPQHINRQEPRNIESPTLSKLNEATSEIVNYDYEIITKASGYTNNYSNELFTRSAQHVVNQDLDDDSADEVSTLTAPTMVSCHRKDPVEENGRVNEPLGRYWNTWKTGQYSADNDGFPTIDPFTEPFFQEPAGASPVPPKSQFKLTSLRIDVPIHDPVGESPLNSMKEVAPSPTISKNVVVDPSPHGSVIKPVTMLKTNAVHTVIDPSPQGFKSISVVGKKGVHQDPLGESPLHKLERGPSPVLDGTPYAPDPPLYVVGLNGNSFSSCESYDIAEKRESEHLPETKSTKTACNASMLDGVSKSPVSITANGLRPSSPGQGLTSLPIQNTTESIIKTIEENSSQVLDVRPISGDHRVGVESSEIDAFSCSSASSDHNSPNQGESNYPKSQSLSPPTFKQTDNARGKDPAESIEEIRVLPPTPAKGQDAEEQFLFRRGIEPESSPARGKDAFGQWPLKRTNVVISKAVSARRTMKSVDQRELALSTSSLVSASAMNNSTRSHRKIECKQKNVGQVSQADLTPAVRSPHNRELDFCPPQRPNLRNTVDTSLVGSELVPTTKLIVESQAVLISNSQGNEKVDEKENAASSCFTPEKASSCSVVLPIFTRRAKSTFKSSQTEEVSLMQGSNNSAQSFTNVDSRDVMSHSTPLSTDKELAVNVSINKDVVCRATMLDNSSVIVAGNEQHLHPEFSRTKPIQEDDTKLKKINSIVSDSTKSNGSLQPVTIPLLKRLAKDCKPGIIDNLQVKDTHTVPSVEKLTALDLISSSVEQTCEVLSVEKSNNDDCIPPSADRDVQNSSNNSQDKKMHASTSFDTNSSQKFKFPILKRSNINQARNEAVSRDPNIQVKTLASSILQRKPTSKSDTFPNENHEHNAEDSAKQVPSTIREKHQNNFLSTQKCDNQSALLVQVNSLAQVHLIECSEEKKADEDDNNADRYSVSQRLDLDDPPTSASQDFTEMNINPDQKTQEEEPLSLFPTSTLKAEPSHFLSLYSRRKHAPTLPSDPVSLPLSGTSDTSSKVTAPPQTINNTASQCKSNNDLARKSEVTGLTTNADAPRRTEFETQKMKRGQLKQPARIAAAWMKSVFSSNKESVDNPVDECFVKHNNGAAKARWQWQAGNSKGKEEKFEHTENNEEDTAQDKTERKKEVFSRQLNEHSLLAKRKAQFLAKASSPGSVSPSQRKPLKYPTDVNRNARRQLPDPPATGSVGLSELNKDCSIEISKAEQFELHSDQPVSSEHATVVKSTCKTAQNESRSVSNMTKSTTNAMNKKETLQLTIATAAQMNAKTLAYLHALNGEPSPRHVWRREHTNYDDNCSPISDGQVVYTSDLRVSPDSNKSSLVDLSANTEVSQTKSRLFAAHSSKFKGRKLSHAPTRKLVQSSQKGRIVLSLEQTKKHVWKKLSLKRDVSISREAVRMGLILLRQQREMDIASGRSARVIPSWAPNVVEVKVCVHESEPQDPILRAGRRLLTKAAIPVQCAARRFLAQKEAVDRMWALLELQSFFRRWRAEAAFISSRVAAIQIQSIFRGVLCRIRLHAQKCSAIQIQRIVRGHLCAMRVYDEVYRVILIQAWLRGILAKKSLSLQLRKAVILQASIRCFLTRIDVANKLRCICYIQTIWRSYYIRSCFQFVVVDIIICQSAARRWAAKKQVEIIRQHRRQSAAVLIQTAWRCFEVNTSYQQYKAATRIQALWRGSKVHKAFRQYKGATVVQAEWRRYARQTSYKQYLAVRKMQALLRRYLIRKNFMMHLACRTIQTIWRGKYIFSKYKCQRAATKLQAVWRGRKCCKKFVRDRSATKIQANWRGVVSVAIYKQYRAATKIQAIWRGMVLSTFYRRHRAAIKIQSIWRGLCAFMYFNHQRSARKIQAVWRGVVVYTHYKRYWATVRIQALWRALKIFRKYKEYQAARRIQAFWRGSFFHTKYRQYRSATRIQAVWRGMKAYTFYFRYRGATKIQAVWRGMIVYTKFVQYVAATKIQTVWRRFLRFTMHRQYWSATKIQALWRTFVLRSVYQEYISATKIQTVWRKVLAITNYIQQRAATKVQTQWRGFILQLIFREFKAARRIQAIWRGKLAYASYQQLRAVITVQACWRGWYQQERFKEFKASRSIQTVWRGFIVFRRYLHRQAANRIQKVWKAHYFELQKRKATKVQSVWRGWTVFIFYKRYTGARTIQALWRMATVHCSYQRYIAARKIQTDWRRGSARSFFKRLKAALKIQAIWRAAVLHASYQRFRNAAIKIQAISRGWMTFRLYTQVIAVVMIQACWRGHKSHSNYKKEKAATRLQAVVKRYLQRELHKQNTNSITIQKTWRCFQAAIAYKNYRAVVKLQAAWRCFQCYTDYIFTLVDILTVQRTARKWLAKRRIVMVRRRSATIKIQTQWRRKYAQLQLLYDLVHIIMVQSLIRRHQAVSKADCLRLEVRGLNNAAIKIQSAFKGFWHYSHFVILRYEAIRIQAMIRGSLIQRKFTMCLGCCIMIQTAARTYLARKRAFALKLEYAAFMTAAHKLRENCACKYIQFWWRVVLECRREKKAALVIERFFLMVKKEVDREIQRVRERKQKSKRRRKKRESDDKRLERILHDIMGEGSMSFISPSNSYASSTTSYLRSFSITDATTGDEEHTDGSPFSKCLGEVVDNTKAGLNEYEHASFDKADRVQNRGIRHRASSPTMRLVMRHDNERGFSDAKNRLLSNQQSPSAEDGIHSVARELLLSKEIKQKYSSDDATLEEAFTAATTTSIDDDSFTTTEKYLKMCGLRPSSSKSSAGHFLFNNDTLSTAGSTISRTSTSSTWAATPKTSRSSTRQRLRVAQLNAEQDKSNLSENEANVFALKNRLESSMGTKTLIELEDAYFGKEFGMI